ncbi:MAG TPA: RHS repeat-associated core domain-containing protein [Anaeromyxobacteraceae bacterium]|nr:RHS repeat-associated core domain-containing protein [Anaeromyxobacteraceae bacterium]
MTNLRLPGQYDERLFAAAGIGGLQGPYYNWNRWYLPNMGRYMEPDPIAKAGGSNGFFGPNWYGYAEGNPLRVTDPTGESAEVCWRRILAPVLGQSEGRHCYVRYNGSPNQTTSYYAPFLWWGWPTVGKDLGPSPADECHPIDPGTCDSCGMRDTNSIDTCLAAKMLECRQCSYSINGFNLLIFRR